MTFHNAVLIQTLFTAKQATIDSEGVYSLDGTVKAGIVNGKPKLGDSNLSVAVDRSLADSVAGLSVGVNAVVLGYSGKLLAGIGAYSFFMSAYTSIAFFWHDGGSATQTPITGYICRAGEFHMWLDYGVGVAVPGWTVKLLNGAISVINSIGGVFSSDARINTTIKPSYGAPLGSARIKDIPTESIPPGCSAKPAA